MHEWVRKKKVSCAQRSLLTYGRAWTTRTVIMHQWKKDINMVLEKASIKQGSANMIKWYKNTMDKVMKMLTEEEKELAEEFRNAEKKGQHYAKEFVKEIWKHCGARVVVMMAWKDNDGEVMVAGQCFPDLEHCWQDDELRHMVRKSKARLQILLPTHQNGTSYIPNIFNLHVPEMKDIMRAFVTFHYRKACGKSTATVPWGAVADNTFTYIVPKYLPHDVTFKESTHLTQDELS
ncbi:hypothetical protein V8B97DRAFT_2021155 [Scleroderma yunnanense]